MCHRKRDIGNQFKYCDQCVIGKGTLVIRSNTVIDDIGNVNRAIRSDNVISVSWEKGHW